MAEDISRGAVVLVLVLTIVVSALSTVIVWEKATQPVTVTKIGAPSTGKVLIDVKEQPQKLEPVGVDASVAITVES